KPKLSWTARPSTMASSLPMVALPALTKLSTASSKPSLPIFTAASGKMPAPRRQSSLSTYHRALSMPHTQDIVQHLWNLFNLLKDDGVTYHEYVTELTFLLFLKMAQETNKESSIPEGHRWKDLESKNEAEMLTSYRGLLLYLGTKTEGRILEIFKDANTSLR